VSPLDRIVVVLWETQDYVNIAGTVRAMKNFGLSRLRLVSPAQWDSWRLLGIAHDTEDVVERIEVFDDLRAALADCSFVAGMTARERRAKRNVARPREIAPELLERASVQAEEGEVGPVAILFGREDAGLPNWALDLCHRTVTIPTNPEHSSLNLAQAVLALGYELWMAAHGEEQPFKEPRRGVQPPASLEQLEQLFEDTEKALWTIDFFKNRQTETIMRTLRSLAHRADLDAREATFLRAIVIETVRFFERTRGEGP
jgi:TrmH family RNA methyltransferase